MSNDSNIIKGLQDLADYLKMTRPTAVKYIDAGLPCWYFNSTYHFHKENVDRFFKAVTAKSIKNPPEEGKEITMSSKESV